MFHVISNLQVKTRVVHQNHHVGHPAAYVLLALPHVPQDGGQMQQYGHKTHIGQFAIVLHQGASLGLHQVTAVETELRFCVVCLQRPHQT